MILSQILLSNFRNFTKANFSLHPQLTIIIGENARGKTSLLESIYFSVFGVGFREWREEELIKWEEDNALIETRFSENDNQHLFQITLHRSGEKVNKQYYVDKTKKTHYMYQQNQTRAVLFAPEHIDIITGSPDKRREYFNIVISAIDMEYGKKLRNYENALRKRNKVLEFYKSEITLKEELSFWNDYLIEQAEYITRKRGEYLDYLNENQEIDTRRCHITYLKNEFTPERLAEKYEKEKLVRRTLVGPQKDDFSIFLKGEKDDKSTHLYGSRSEQRLAVFWLKLNEINYFIDILKKKPILLLDDVFSELDSYNKKLVMDMLHKYQTVLTTTEAEMVEIAALDKEVIRL